MGPLRLAFFVGVILKLLSSNWTAASSLESPVFSVVHVQQDRQFEIRRYENIVWIAAPSSEDISFVRATQLAVQKLLDWWPTFLPSTEPVITGIRPSDGPFCATTFSVRIYLPSEYEAVVVLPKGIQIERWGKQQCVAVRSFNGSAQDANVARETSHLANSLKGTPWEIILDTEPSSSRDEYVIAQYGSVYDDGTRRSEAWILIDTARGDCSLQRGVLKST